MMASSLSTASATGNPRNKVALKPGRSLMDWIRLTNSGQDLTGCGGILRDVSLEELAQHNKRNDAWIALRGKVYNVTSYIEFHPGGEEELLRGVGVDATNLFEEVHKWVNYESMLQKCLVGCLKPSLVAVHRTIAKMKSPSIIKPRATLPTPVISPKLAHDWIQTSSTVTLIIYSRQQGLELADISAFCDGHQLQIRIYHGTDQCCDFSVNLECEVVPTCTIKVSSISGKIEVSLSKIDNNIFWKAIGHVNPQSGIPCLRKTAPTFYRKAILLRKIDVTHNVRLFTFSFSCGNSFSIPIGRHIRMKLNLEDNREVIRSYTPVVNSLMEEVIDVPYCDGGSQICVPFLIKIYPMGPLTCELDRLAIGETVEISDQEGSFLASKLHGKDLIAIAAGTGVTPMIRLILSVLKSNKKAQLLFFNKQRRDIIWEKEFSSLTEKYERFQVRHVLSQPDSDWTGMTGNIIRDILEQELNGNDPLASSLICVCGPTEFTLKTLRILHDMKLSDENIHAFMEQ